jgi:NAD(P)-dependent dehydrogenase (short-subunit alcohol dehydrogenase family)
VGKLLLNGDLHASPDLNPHNILVVMLTGRLAGKIAVITGGARGIGLACGKVMAKEGAKVVLADVDLPAAEAAVAELSQQGHSALAVKCDVRQAADVNALMQRAAEWGGGLDVCVANAGEQGWGMVCA